MALDFDVESPSSWPLVALNGAIGFAISAGCMTFASTACLVDFTTRPKDRACTLTHNGARAVALLGRETRRRGTDVHLSGFAAWPYRRGAGTELARQVLVHLDDTHQSVGLSCWPTLAPFYARGGFEIMRRRWWGTLGSGRYALTRTHPSPEPTPLNAWSREKLEQWLRDHPLVSTSGIERLT